MKASVISEINKVFKKLVWVEECSGGFYVGFCGKAQEMHYSYHRDGMVHIKTGSNYLPLYRATAIENIKKFISIVSCGITLEGGYEFATSDYKKIKDANTVIYINPEIIKRKKILNINTYILRRGAEKDCISDLNEAYKALKEQSFEVLSANFFKLDNFKDFLVGIILCGGR